MCLIGEPYVTVYAVYKKKKKITAQDTRFGTIWDQLHLFSTPERRTIWLLAAGIEGLTGIQVQTKPGDPNNGRWEHGDYMIEDVHLDWPLRCH